MNSEQICFCIDIDNGYMESLKKIIRSVLITLRNGLTESELEMYYKHLLGQSIPFKEHGFQTLQELLKSMPGVCVIESETGSQRYYAVADESTKHLEKLVIEQEDSDSDDDDDDDDDEGDMRLQVLAVYSVFVL